MNMSVITKLRSKSGEQTMVEERGKLPPAVQRHIESIENLYGQLEAAERRCENYRKAVENGNVEIRALRMEIESLKRLTDYEVNLRRHFERLANDLMISLGNVEDSVKAIFKRVHEVEADAKQREDEARAEAVRSAQVGPVSPYAPKGTIEANAEVDAPPKFLLNQDKFKEDIDGSKG
jgi:chromosome segregation ATPase